MSCTSQNSIGRNRKIGAYRGVRGIASEHKHETSDGHEDGQQQTAQVQQRAVAPLCQIDEGVGDKGNAGEEEEPGPKQLVVLEVIPAQYNRSGCCKIQIHWCYVGINVVIATLVETPLDRDGAVWTQAMR